MRFIFLLLLLYVQIISNVAVAHVISCQDWLQADNFTAITDESIASDVYGTAGVCTDKFPTINERLKFHRVVDDDLEAIYYVTYQYCNGARNVFVSGSPCRSCDKFNWSTASCDVYKDMWTNTSSVSYADTEFNMIKKAGPDYVCMNRVKPNEAFLHKTNNINTSGKSQVCAYVVNPSASLYDDGCREPLLYWQYALIGCVIEPPKPGPGTLNLSIPGLRKPSVDKETPLENANNKPGYLAMGSTFEAPMVRLMQRKTKEIIAAELKLFYHFHSSTQTPDKPQCSKFPDPDNNIQYCAVVTPNNPSQVCACEEQKCDKGLFLGCVPRPTLKQSNLAIMAEYREQFGEDEVMYPAISMDFVRTREDGVKLITDAEGSLVDIGENEMFYKYDEASKKISNIPAVEPIKINKLPLPDDNFAIKEFSLVPDEGTEIKFYSVDKKSVYGIDFTAIIPELKENGDIKQVRVSKPGPANPCDAITVSEDTMNSLMPVAGGVRDMTPCCPAEYEDKTQCFIPPPLECSGVPQKTHEQEAVKTLCYGLYQGPSDSAKQDKICLLSQNWDVAKPEDKICVTIPKYCWETKVPKLGTGLAAWEKINSNEKQNGACLAEYGVENAKAVEVVAKSEMSSASVAIQTAALAELKVMQATLDSLKLLYGPLNINIPQALLQDGEHYKYQITESPPERFCNAGTKTGTILKSCAYKPSCGPITQSTDFTGYATWPDASSTFTKAGTNTGQVLTDISTVNGVCVAPYAATGDRIVQRKCVTLYKETTASAQDGQTEAAPAPSSQASVVSQYWDVITNPCQKSSGN